jgi:hypothetical protein
MWKKIVIVVLILLLVVGSIIFFYNRRKKELFDDHNIKNQKNTINEEKIKKIYEGLSGFTKSESDKYNTTYGEITFAGIDSISKFLDENKIKKDIFIDLGCGIGKSLLMAIMNGFEKAYGTELVKERYDIAMKAYEKMDESDKKNIEIYNQDLFNFNKLSELDRSKNVVVFISNLLYDNNMNIKLFNHLRVLPIGSIIIVSKKPSKNIDNIIFEKLIRVPMSWNDLSECYVYKVV